MTTCSRCGTHLWFGSTDCPTCDPSPAQDRPGPAGHAPGVAPLVGSAVAAVPGRPAAAAVPGRPAAAAVPGRPAAAFAGTVIVAVGEAVGPPSANDGGVAAPEPVPAGRRRRRWAAAALAAAGAIAVGSLLASFPGAGGGAGATTGELRARLVEDGVPPASARCVANALVGGLDDAEWSSLHGAAAAGIPDSLRAKVASLTAAC